MHRGLIVVQAEGDKEPHSALIAARATARRRFIEAVWTDDGCRHAEVDVLRICRTCGQDVADSGQGGTVTAGLKHVLAGIARRFSTARTCSEHAAVIHGTEQESTTLAERAAAWLRRLDGEWSGDSCAHAQIDLLGMCRRCGAHVAERDR